MKIIEVTDRNPLLIERLLEVWETSVKATHLLVYIILRDIFYKVYQI